MATGGASSVCPGKQRGPALKTHRAPHRADAESTRRRQRTSFPEPTENPGPPGDPNLECLNQCGFLVQPLRASPSGPPPPSTAPASSPKPPLREALPGLGQAAQTLPSTRIFPPRQPAAGRALPVPRFTSQTEAPTLHPTQPASITQSLQARELPPRALFAHTFSCHPEHHHR